MATISDIILPRNELLFLLNKFGAKRVAGMEFEEFELPGEKFSSFLQSGEKQLIADGLINPQTKEVKSPELVNLIRTIGFRDLALIAIRGVKGYGRQLFIFNFYKDSIVMHTLPEEGRHYLKLISSMDELFKLLNQLFPFLPVIQKERPQFKISKIEFESALKMLGSGKKNPAVKIFKQTGLRSDLLSPLIQSLSSPELTLSLACLLINNDEIQEASSASIFADHNSAWGIWPDNSAKDPDALLVFPSGITDIYSAVTDWLEARGQGE